MFNNDDGGSGHHLCDGPVRAASHSQTGRPASWLGWLPTAFVGGPLNTPLAGSLPPSSAGGGLSRPKWLPKG